MKRRLKIILITILVLIYLLRMHFNNKIGIPGPVLMIGVASIDFETNEYKHCLFKVTNYGIKEEVKEPFVKFANIGLYFDIVGIGEYYK